MSHKTPSQIAADNRHKRLSLATNRAKPRNTQQLVIAPRSNTPYRDWNKHNER
jgi:hypothetical protein